MDREELEWRVERACHRLTIQYARLIDLYDVDGLAALFAEDALWHRPGNAPLEGRKAIRGFLARRDPTILTRHIQSNFLLETFSEDEATATSYYSGYNADGFGAIGKATARPPFSTGEYHDRFRRTPEGWRFAERKTQHVFHGFEWCSAAGR